MMAGAKPVRGRYAAAGYRAEGKKNAGRQEEARSGKRERELYIADVPAGSPQDSLRDLNRPGYRSERPWREEAPPLFEEQPGTGRADDAAHRSTRTRQAVRSRRKKGLLERMADEASRDKKGVAMCVALGVVCLMLSSAWAQKMVAGVEIQQMIASYQAQTQSFEQENESLSQQLEMAKSGERIRNLAQNELGMLRPERAQTETIYIQAPDTPVQETAQENSEPQMELLDFLLGLLNVFHRGE